MFERYSDRARRVLFFARYEVAQRGGLSIEPEHLVLGVLRDNARALLKFAAAGVTTDTIRARLESQSAAGRRPTSGGIPFSPSCSQR
jgi:ATP-dependent Clp protease ATP-binding subunit ClpC